MESRIIELTKADITNNKLNIRPCGEEFFPKDTFGGPSEEFKAPRHVRLWAEAITEPIDTDLVCENSGRPMWIFRARSWVGKFVETNRLNAGNKILIMRIGQYDYRITPLWRPFTFIDLFAGIGGIRLAFEAVGGRCVFSSEIDPLAQQTYEANFGEKPDGDITKISPNTIPDHDILLGGFPCQSFSIIGNRKGFADTRGTLYFNIEQVLEAKRPSAVLLENVKQFRTHDNGRTFRTVIQSLESLGYHTHDTILNALNYGVPQKRERTFIAAFLEDIEFSFPKPFPSRPSLDAVFESDDTVDPDLIASEYIQKKRLERLRKQGVTPFYPSMWHENKGGYIGIHPFSCALRANASYNYLLVNGRRRPSGRECLRLQGFPDTFKMAVPHQAIRAQAGNAVAVPLITAIASRMMVALHNHKILRRSLFDDVQPSEPTYTLTEINSPGKVSHEFAEETL
ncbi:MAG: DNA (cytosine-5-)-methyltransferase [Eubacteriales bacterium]|jgi:DNA (cytosine-5)-methyltransferase 1